MFVPDEGIICTVTDGYVTLEGVVDRLSQRDDAERAVRNLTGVKAVANKITLRRRPRSTTPSPTPSSAPWSAAPSVTRARSASTSTTASRP